MNLPNFRAEVARNNMTYDEIAGILGISATALRNKLSGKSDFKSKEIVRLRNAMGLSLEQIDSIFFSA